MTQAAAGRKLRRMSEGRGASVIVDRRRRYVVDTPGAQRRNDRRGARRTGTSGKAAAVEQEGFPGCEAVPMNAAQFARFDRHVEYWDARSGIAWLVAEASIEHERPAVRLAVLMHRIAQARGLPIACCGTVSLHGRGPEGQRRVVEADQTIYLDAAKANALRSPVPGAVGWCASPLAQRRRTARKPASLRPSSAVRERIAAMAMPRRSHIRRAASAAWPAPPTTAGRPRAQYLPFGPRRGRRA